MAARDKSKDKGPADEAARILADADAIRAEVQAAATNLLASADQEIAELRAASLRETEAEAARIRAAALDDAARIVEKAKLAAQDNLEWAQEEADRIIAGARHATDADRGVGSRSARLAEEAMAVLRSIHGLGTLALDAANLEAQRVRNESSRLEAELDVTRAALADTAERLRQVLDTESGRSASN